jgi:hypothetical protein
MADNIALTQPDLINRLLDNLPAGYSADDVELPNWRPQTQLNRKWLRISVLPGATTNVQADGFYKRTFGFCVVDCFYPVGSGDQAQLNDVKLIQDLFENKEFGNTKTQEASLLNVGADGAWYHQQVNINFYFEGN